MNWIFTKMVDNTGQSTVEAALIAMSLLAIMTTLGVWFYQASEGVLLNKVLDHASHTLHEGSSIGLKDVVLY